MKKNQLVLSCLGMFMFIAISCQKSRDIQSPEYQAPIIEEETLAGKPKGNSGPCNPNAYVVTLLSSNVEVQPGIYEWVWTVQNPNPGNGNNGTSQGLSHWGFTLGPCVNTSNLIDAGVSGNGSSWSNFSPNYQPDPSQSCQTNAVVKFDYGTSGSAPSYYRLRLNAQFPVSATASGYYKSGANTGCCTFDFEGIGCEDDGGEIR
jgi:hypothetical protein